MPSLGADMEAGKLVEWLVKPGDTVNRGDVVAVVETQKGAIEIEIFESGIVQTLEAELGQTLPVGAPLARIGKPDDAEAAAAPRAEPAPPGPEREYGQSVQEAEAAKPRPATTPEATGPLTANVKSVPPPPPSAVPAGREGAPPASPAARRLAAERGVDLAAVTGSGPGGAILLVDVERAAGASAPSAQRPRAGPDLDAMRGAIAAAMARSKREIPHYYLSHDIDLQPATDWLGDQNARRGPEARLLMGALLVKAVARAAAETPELNGRLENGVFRPSADVHAGVAVALRGGGLIAPAIRDAAGRDLDALMEAMRDLVSRVRAGRLRSSELGEGTITVSALGERGVDAMTGVIYPPQVALVAFGTPRLAPRVVGEAVTARTCVTVTLAADHRVSDGRRGARFLQRIALLLNRPEAL